MVLFIRRTHIGMTVDVKKFFTVLSSHRRILSLNLLVGQSSMNKLSYSIYFTVQEIEIFFFFHNVSGFLCYFTFS